MLWSKQQCTILKTMSCHLSHKTILNTLPSIASFMGLFEKLTINFRDDAWQKNEIFGKCIVATNSAFGIQKQNYSSKRSMSEKKNTNIA
jgi:hypothetical protein